MENVQDQPTGTAPWRTPALHRLTGGDAAGGKPYLTTETVLSFGPS
ncbi:MAG: hypothetical protein JWO76_855 [Nocardioides sp.]|nr:hypothetical protein [Nocardioides sp.]